MLRTTLALIGCLALAGCSASSAQRPTLAQMLQQGPKVGKVVATELAFARAAQDKGQWTAFDEFSADGALLFGRNGAIEAKPWLQQQTNPPAAVSWEPHRVWSSCDGSLAITQGGFVTPEGGVGTFNTVWQRQEDGEYRWVFDFGVPQAEAPVKPDMIASSVAECGARPPAPQVDQGARLSTSRDGTLAWSFHLVGEGERRYDVWIAKEDGWAQVVEVNLAPTAESGE